MNPGLSAVLAHCRHCNDGGQWCRFIWHALLSCSRCYCAITQRHADRRELTVCRQNVNVNFVSPACTVARPTLTGTSTASCFHSWLRQREGVQTLQYIGGSDITESMVVIRSPFWGITRHSVTSLMAKICRVIDMKLNQFKKMSIGSLTYQHSVFKRYRSDKHF